MAPNVLLITLDQFRGDSLSCAGHPVVRTPHLDRLAREGTRFTDAHAPSSVCTPTRYALLTGEYPFRVNSWGPVFARAGLIIDPGKLTLPRLLRQAGYATTCIGKWHLGASPEFRPMRRGFTETYGFIGGGHRFRDWREDIAVLKELGRAGVPLYLFWPPGAPQPRILPQVLTESLILSELASIPPAKR